MTSLGYRQPFLKHRGLSAKLAFLIGQIPDRCLLNQEPLPGLRDPHTGIVIVDILLGLQAGVSHGKS